MVKADFATPELRVMAATVAKMHELSAKLVWALVEVESGWDPCAWNPEPRYRYLWDVSGRKPFRALSEAEMGSKVPPADFPAIAGDPDQEWWAQQASWGLMQVMGAVAREQGERRPYLTCLIDPQVSLGHGCRRLARELEWAGGDANRALAAYNGGRSGNAAPPFRSQAYATKVLRVLSTLDGTHYA